MMRFVMIIIYACMASGTSILEQNNPVVLDLPKPHSIHQLGQKRKLANSKGSELIPLFPGYGTHFTYVYVGTPPQRQTLIIDTGSHYTTFPCTECINCGSHTDKYWAPKNSTTYKKSICGGKPMCSIKQQYTEGSSWEGFEAQDKIWPGDMESSLLPGANEYAVDFNFACQTKATGLFRTQLADGILGLSNSPDTLPNQLASKGVTTSSTFALCFRIGGGIMTLGGVDQRVSPKPIKYAQMINVGAKIGKSTKNQTDVEGDKANWFGVRILQVQLQSKTNGESIPLTDKVNLFNSGKGVIIDSGTTDTYFPKALSADISAAFQKITGFPLVSKPFSLPPNFDKEKLKSLPTFIFTLKGKGNDSNVVVNMPYTSYLETVENGMYQFSIYTSEDDGTVLGANFMMGKNIVFDTDNKRIGFAASDCNYQTFQPNIHDESTESGPALAENDNKDGTVSGPTAEDCYKMIPLSECTATCEEDKNFYISKGTQDWINKCDTDLNGQTVTKPCSENCAKDSIVRGNPECPDKPWTDCSSSCIKSRKSVPKTEKMKVNGKCNYQTQTSTCYAGSCPVEDGDFIVYIDLRVGISPTKWSYVYAESFFDAMSSLFKLKQHSVELLNDSGNEYFLGTKMHFKLRLKAKDYVDTESLTDAADLIVESVRSAQFPGKLIRALDAASSKYDGEKVNRFGWMFDEDIEVLSAVAMPMGKVRDTYGEIADNHDEPQGLSDTEKIDLFLLGIAITAVLILAFVLYLHMKLRQQHALYEKDKIHMTSGDKTLHNILNKIVSSSTSTTDKDIEMSKRSLMRSVDEDLED